jgi:hypothetical protein
MQPEGFRNLSYLQAMPTGRKGKSGRGAPVSRPREGEAAASEGGRLRMEAMPAHQLVCSESALRS